MDYDYYNLVAKENHRQAFLEEKQAIRQIQQRKISAVKKAQLVKELRNPIHSDDLSYLAGGVY